VRNIYDHRSRRIRKDVAVWDGQADGFAPQSSAHYLWDGWNIFRETVTVGSGSTQSAVTNYYTWGSDLSGSLQGAGGVGGLLSVTTVSTANPQPVIHFPMYDANGNITEYVATNGMVVARYEYDAFGATVAATGPLAETFTHRFSTKPFDVETGLVMYQLRPYEPNLGRWLSRDPIGIKGGLNEYGFVNNDGVNHWDKLGLYKVKKCSFQILVGHNTKSEKQKWGIMPKNIKSGNCSAVSVHSCWSENIDINGEKNPDGISDSIGIPDAIAAAQSAFDNADRQVRNICSASDENGKPCCCKKVKVKIICRFGFDFLRRLSMPAGFCGKTKTIKCER
jgi:RHS repeat-associated protein